MEQFDFDPDRFSAELNAAAQALRSFATGAGREAANDLSASFEQAGARIARALGRAAEGGEASFRRLAQVALEELAKVALDRVFGDTRREASASAAGAVAVHFHMNAGADAAGVTRNQGQIAAAIARAVAYGRKNL